MAQKFQGIAHVIHLTAPFVVTARAVADAAKVETQRRHTQRLQGLGNLEDHLIMHGPTAKGMRVADNRAKNRLDLFLLRLENPLQVPRWCRDIDV